MSKPRACLAFALAVLDSATEHDVKYPAAALAYYGFVAFLPLLVLVVSLVGESLAARLNETIPQLLTPEASVLVYESLSVASGRTGATVFAIVVLAWSGANMVVGFQTVVERVEGIPDRSVAEQLRDAGSVLGSLCLAGGAVVFTGRFFAVLSAGPYFAWWQPGVMFVTLSVAFLPLYYLPSRAVSGPLSALPGALTAAFGWTALVTIVQFYVANAAQYALYGILSGVILIFTSLYLAALALALGVVVNVTFDARRGAAASIRPGLSP